MHVGFISAATTRCHTAAVTTAAVPKRRRRWPHQHRVHTCKLPRACTAAWTWATSLLEERTRPSQLQGPRTTWLFYSRQPVLQLLPMRAPTPAAHPRTPIHHRQTSSICPSPHAGARPQGPPKKMRSCWTTRPLLPRSWRMLMRTASPARSNLSWFPLCPHASAVCELAAHQHLPPHPQQVLWTLHSLCPTPHPTPLLLQLMLHTPGLGCTPPSFCCCSSNSSCCTCACWVLVRFRPRHPTPTSYVSCPPCSPTLS
mmetsp:Transcript_10085/g.27592  ORF Transcript_10085/g.27592 Transcript_10085/m.27592 type:complete len:256 (+) Transcript_10085:431-1198(+)